MHLVAYGITQMASIHNAAKEGKIDEYLPEELMHLPYPGREHLLIFV